MSQHTYKATAFYHLNAESLIKSTISQYHSGIANLPEALLLTDPNFVRGYRQCGTDQCQCCGIEEGPRSLWWWTHYWRSSHSELLICWLEEMELDRQEEKQLNKVVGTIFLHLIHSPWTPHTSNDLFPITLQQSSTKMVLVKELMPPAWWDPRYT